MTHEYAIPIFMILAFYMVGLDDLCSGL